MLDCTFWTKLDPSCWKIQSGCFLSGHFCTLTRLDNPKIVLLHVHTHQSNNHITSQNPGDVTTLQFSGMGPPKITRCKFHHTNIIIYRYQIDMLIYGHRNKIDKILNDSLASFILYNTTFRNRFLNFRNWIEPVASSRLCACFESNIISYSISLLTFVWLFGVRLGWCWCCPLLWQLGRELISTHPPSR